MSNIPTELYNYIRAQINSVRIPRPGFKYYSTTQIVVPASVASPAVVRLDGSIYTNTADALGSLDTGSLAANTLYYAYAAPGASEKSFTTYFSATAPSAKTGVWSYLGAFGSQSGGAIIRGFISHQGRYYSDNYWGGSAAVQTTTWTQYTVPVVPSTIKAHFGICYVASTAVGDQSYFSGLGPSGGTTTSRAVEQINQITSGSLEDYGLIPALSGANIFIAVNNVRATARYWPSGWVEDPMDYV